jgi:ubiquinone/menaquinone biosynthesis C-methylase UbiE
MADYGLDAPQDVRKLAIRGLVLVLIGVVMSVTNPGSNNPLIRIAWWAGAAFLFSAGVMVFSSRYTKPKLRDRILNSLPWRGDEQVLDVGCGRGLMLIGAAKKLTSGRATGIDIWRQEDLRNNTAEATLANAKDEGVAGKVRVEDSDARKLPFKDATFDVVLSSLAIHNIDGRIERAKALAEMVRVLKPGGHIAILDIIRTGEYAKELERLGLTSLKLSKMSLDWCMPTKYLIAQKP